MTGGPISGPTHPLQGSFRTRLPRIALIVLSRHRSRVVPMFFPAASPKSYIRHNANNYNGYWWMTCCLAHSSCMTKLLIKSPGLVACTNTWRCGAAQFRYGCEAGNELSSPGYRQHEETRRFRGYTQTEGTSTLGGRFVNRGGTSYHLK